MSIYTNPKPFTNVNHWAEDNPTDPDSSQPAIAVPSGARYANGFSFKQFIPRQFLNYLFNILTVADDWLLRSSIDIDDAFTADRSRLDAVESDLVGVVYGGEVLYEDAWFGMLGPSNVTSTFSTVCRVAIQRIGNQIFGTVVMPSSLHNDTGANFSGPFYIKFASAPILALLAQIVATSSNMYDGVASTTPLFASIDSTVEIAFGLYTNTVQDGLLSAAASSSRAPEYVMNMVPAGRTVSFGAGIMRFVLNIA